MKIWLKERIGNPELFTGRKKDMSYFLNWIDKINFERSNSSAILSRRKTGKTALMQRLFNITFNKNKNVVPFYFEIRETDQWLADFAEEFFLTFVYQFIAFKTRKAEYMDTAQMGSFKNAAEIARKEGFEYLESVAVNALEISREGKTDRLWNVVRETPRMTAAHYNMYVVQMIDEFQFINRHIFRDQYCEHCIDNLAGSYLHTCEYKNAPLLVSGSWVGWLTRALQKMLPGRFQFHYMDNISQEEAIEMILKYSYLEDIPVTENTVNLLAGITEGNPFYIGSMFRSKYFEKDFTTEQGILKTLEYETLNREGTIRGTWMEYVLYALDEVNNVNAKKIVLYLCKNREREVSRKEIKEELGLEMSDSELEKKMRTLVKADIIEQGQGNFFYRGVPDNIFDKVFRGVYAAEIEALDHEDLINEYRELSEKLKKDNKSLMGEYSHFKGKFAEYLIIENFRYRANKNQAFYKNMINNLPEDFQFAEYETVWSYSASPVYKRDIQIDIFAKAKDNEYSLIGEVKHRRSKFSVKEAEFFTKKAKELMEIENIEKAVLFVFSSNGFFKNTLAHLNKYGIAWSDDKRLLKRKK